MKSLYFPTQKKVRRVALFSIFANSFSAWPTSRQLESSPRFCKITSHVASEKFHWGLMRWSGKGREYSSIITKPILPHPLPGSLPTQNRWSKKS